jgi:hypothetical protein
MRGLKFFIEKYKKNIKLSAISKSDVEEDDEYESGRRKSTKYVGKTDVSNARLSGWMRRRRD